MAIRWHQKSSEELVVRFLRARQLKHVSTVHHIERDCRQYWYPKGVWRAASTYRRAFQRLLADGQLGDYTFTDVRGHDGKKKAPGKGERQWSYRVFHLRRPVTEAKVALIAPIPHGNKEAGNAR